MGKIFKYIIVIIFFVLVASNLYIFVSSMTLSESINYYETQTRKLKQSNMDLEKKLYSLDSLQYAVTLASKMDFTNKAEPFYLENLGFALKK